LLLCYVYVGCLPLNVQGAKKDREKDEKVAISISIGELEEENKQVVTD